MKTIRESLESKQCDPIYPTLFGTREKIVQSMNEARLRMTEGLRTMAQSATVDQYDWFKEDDMDTALRTNIMGVYTAVLEKDGSRPLYYVGSGTDIRQGMYRRMTRYRDGTCISVGMNQAFQHGYQLTNFRVLYSVNRRAPIDAGRLQHLVLLFEATMMFVFAAVNEGEPGFSFARRLFTGSWEADIDSDRGLCLVCPLTETRVGDISLDEEEEALQTSRVEGQNEDCAVCGGFFASRPALERHASSQHTFEEITQSLNEHFEQNRRIF